MNRQFRNNNNSEMPNQDQIKLDKIKHGWYHISPPKLYDLCIETIVKNIDLILVKSNSIKIKNSILNDSKDQKVKLDNSEPNELMDLKEEAATTSKSTVSKKKNSSSSSSKKRHRRHKKKEHKKDKKKRSHRKSYVKYRLADQVGPLPNCICESLLREYSKFYLKQLGKYERDEYFEVINSQTKATTNKQKRNYSKLVSYYDFLMSFATRPEKCNLNSIDYRQCMWSTSKLEQRLKTKLTNKLANNQPIETNYFKLDNNSSDSSDNEDNTNEARKKPNKNNNKLIKKQMDFDLINSTNSDRLKSLRAKQKSHLNDKDIKLIIKNQSKLNTLDICPCMLTNKTILLINKYLNNNYLRVLRLENCCNWNSKNSNNANLNNNDPNDADDIVDEMNNHQNNNHHLQLRFQSSSDEWSTENEENEFLNDIYNPDLDEDDYSDFEDNNLIDFAASAQMNNNNNNNININNTIANNQNNEIENNQQLSIQEYLINDSSNLNNNINNQIIYNPDDDQDDESNQGEDDDDDDFDAYLQEYVNRYELASENTNNRQIHNDQQNLIVNHRKNKRYGSNNKEIKSSNKMLNYIKKLSKILDKTREQLNNNRKKMSNNKSNECKLFKPSNKSILFSINEYENLTNSKYATKNDKKYLSAKKKNKKNKRRKRIKKSSSTNEEEQEDSNDKKQTEESSGNGGNLLNWIVKKSTLNEDTNAEVAASNSSSNQPISLIDKIKKGAAILAETKMIDKVSISSSNYDDYDLNNLNNTNNNSKFDECSDLLINRDEILKMDQDYFDDDDDNSITDKNNKISSASSSSSSKSSSSIYLSYDENNDELLDTSSSSDSSSSTSSSSFSSSSFLSSLSLYTTGSSSSEYSSSDHDENVADKLSVLKKRISKQSKSNKNSTSKTINENNQQCLLRNKKLIRQQRLLERVANIGSSPINVLQAIAAKALNFKLKNSISNYQDEDCDEIDIKDEEDSEDRKYNRLFRQYKFLRSTNINKDNDVEMNDQYNNNAAQLMDDNQDDLVNKPGTSRSFNDHNHNLHTHQQNLSSNLFSVLKYWMSKRVDSFNSSNTANVNTSSKQNNSSTASSNSSTNDNNNNASIKISQQNKKFQLKLNKIKRLAKLITETTSGNAATAMTNNNNEGQTTTNQSIVKLIDEDFRNFKKFLKKNSNNKEANNNRELILMNKLNNLLVETINLNNLQHLSLRNLGSNVIRRPILNNLLKNLTCLKYLDISNCCTNQLYYIKTQNSRFNTKSTEDELSVVAATNGKELVGGLDGLLNLAHSLTHLILADLSTDDIQSNLPYLLKLQKLKHLDLSNCREKLPLNSYKNPSLVLAKIVYHLTMLSSLDISGTNLGGSTIFKEADEIEYIKKRLYEDLKFNLDNDYQEKLEKFIPITSGVCGLMFLNNEKKKLDFLGCFCCDNSVSSRLNIPALRIAGEENEKHLYTSLEAYMTDRPLFLLDALNHLFELYRDEHIVDKLLGGHLIMNTMEKHLDNSKIQISGSASLFYVLKYWKEENSQLPPFYLKRLIQAVINGMEEHIDEPAVI